MSRSRSFGSLRVNSSPKVHCITQLIHFSFYNYIHCIRQLKQIEKVPQPRYVMQQASESMSRREQHVHTSPASAHLQGAQVNYSNVTFCQVMPLSRDPVQTGYETMEKTLPQLKDSIYYRQSDWLFSPWACMSPLWPLLPDPPPQALPGTDSGETHQGH
jgi:hypothetical protein